MLTRAIRLRRAPYLYALALSAGYLIISTTWILFSTAFVSLTSTSIQQMEKLETIKGIGFVVFSSILLFAFSAWGFKRFARSAQDLLTSQRQVVQAEREAMTGLLASSIAHDMANILTILRLNLEKLKTSIIPNGGLHTVNKIDHAVGRLTDLSQRLKTAGRQLIDLKPHEFDFTHAISETIAMVRFHPAVRDCDILFDAPSKIILCGQPVLVHQLVMNLLINAAEATGEHGRIKVVARQLKNGVVLEVHDNGPGVDPENREKIFERFYTTKKEGTGLGLLSVKTSIDLHGGSIEIGESPLGGALFRIQLRHQGQVKAVPEAEVPIAPVDSILT